VKVGFVGLGNIGAPIAEHLLDWPGGLVVADVRTEATEPFAARGAEVASDATGVALAGAGIISVMVLDDAQVRAVVDAILPVARQGTVIAVHSTIRPETAEELAALASERGVSVIDAPVSGGAMGASAGTLAVMIGGDRDAYERCKAPFSTFAELVLHFGPAGAGTRAKIARNLLTFVGYAAAAEAQRLAEQAGVDLRKLAGVVRHSDAITGGPGAIMLRDTTAAVDPSDGLFEILCHTRTLGEKDLALALELAGELGVDLPMTQFAADHLAEALGVPHHDRPEHPT
jgi:3-hydroxyisobutyrate dehydrogenase-like beta-hydroxyacid dehydrogenase